MDNLFGKSYFIIKIYFSHAINLFKQFIFRFTKLDSDSEYPIIQGIAHNRVWKFRRADEQTISYEVLGRFSGAVEEEDHAALYEYFQVIFYIFKQILIYNL